MLRGSLRAAAVVLPIAAIVLWTTMLVSGQAGAKNGEWPHWGGDSGGTKYSPLDQINRDNVKNLRIAWRWKADNYGQRADANMKANR